MDAETLVEMARHQVWADTAHWKLLRENQALFQDAEIRTRLNHMLNAMKMLLTLAQGQTPDLSKKSEIESLDELESSMGKALGDLTSAAGSADLNRMVSLPRGPKGPFDAPVGVLLLQALTHCQHHRGQNASRIRQLGATPPMTDFVVWYAQGRP